MQKEGEMIEAADSDKIILLKKDSYIAHVQPETKRTQTFSEHYMNVAYLTEKNCPIEELKNMAWLCAILHDCGKLSDEFWNYMKEVLEFGNDARRRQIDHYTAGGRIIENLDPGNLAAEMISTAIYSHHGLQDCIDMEGRTLSEIRRGKIIDFEKISERYFTLMDKSILENRFLLAKADAEQIKKKIVSVTKESGDNVKGNVRFYLGMYQRLLLSLLIDSDWSDTASFSEDIPLPERFSTKETQKVWKQSINNFEQHMSGLSKEGSKSGTVSPLNIYRQEISDTCRTAAEDGARLYRLTVPTGAGKTFSSLRFALYHADKFKKKHIIYVAPFNSILEQNARDIRQAVGNDQFVLEHHCNIVHENKEDDREYRRLTESWDSPIIVTTAVQLLNTLFSDKKSSIRRMYNLCNSVIIFDEVQAFPASCTELFNLAVNFLTAFCNTTVVLCSATQPSLAKLEENRVFNSGEMAGDVERYVNAFKRTLIEDKTGLISGGMEIDDLKDFVEAIFQNNKSILIIVNTKSCAHSLYEALKVSSGDKCELYHLSTNMCVKNRRDVLDEVKKTLKKGKSVICVSTQIIEAGVNISFQCVIRSMAGLDSVIQAAGRCNRHLECKELGIVYIVKMSSNAEKLGSLREIRVAQEALGAVLDAYKKKPELFDGRLDSQKTIGFYYKKYFEQMLHGTTKYPVVVEGGVPANLVDLLSQNSLGRAQYVRAHNGKGPKSPLNQAFKTAGEKFQVIPEDEKVEVIIPYDNDAKASIERLSDPYIPLSEKKLELRKLQIYSVGISKQTKDKLSNAIYSISEGTVLILNDSYYDDKVGVLDSPKLKEMFF